ncbi:MAG: thioredoxin-like domain-containing protein [Pyrinomonadaceae bacterium]
MAMPQEGRVRAPELTGGRGWLNTDKPLSLAGLKGKVVLLDFWTYGCINCVHIIPDLKKLEAKYANQLVVIGVHSAKFENEKETENIRRIILRYELEHPVVNDADFKIWSAYAVRAWPTQILIDPAGYVVGAVEGEGNYETLDQHIAETIAEFRKRGELNEQPLSLALERAKVGDLPLAFPGKVLADEKSRRLFIADSNHNRIVVAKLDGTLLNTIGTGASGRDDGAYERATFHRPQGMALDGDALYVADTENNSIRRVNLKTRVVETVASNETTKREQAAQVTGGALSSPWDLQLLNRTLYIAMAGPHQIWKLDLAKNEISQFAGTRREARLDGAVSEAAFAQPSGITSDGMNLYVADSESNIIRAIDATNPNPSVQTLVGGDLFEFGDKDGTGDDARLQHPLGVTAAATNGGGKDGGATIYVADTYNHKIKQLDTKSRTIKTFAGTGKPGQADGASPSFYEPGGLSIAGGKLYVADTNNQAVRVVDLQTKQTATLQIRGLTPPASNAGADATNSTAANAAGLSAEEIKLAPQRLRLSGAGESSALVVDVALPEGYHLNASAPQRYKISVADGSSKSPQVVAFASSTAGGAKQSESGGKIAQLPLRVPVQALAAGTTNLRIALTLYYCREDNTGTCRIKTLQWRAPVEVTADAAAPRELKVTGRIEIL